MLDNKVKVKIEVKVKNEVKVGKDFRYALQSLQGDRGDRVTKFIFKFSN